MTFLYGILNENKRQSKNIEIFVCIVLVLVLLLAQLLLYDDDDDDDRDIDVLQIPCAECDYVLFALNVITLLSFSHTICDMHTIQRDHKMGEAFFILYNVHSKLFSLLFQTEIPFLAFYDVIWNITYYLTLKHIPHKDDAILYFKIHYKSHAKLFQSIISFNS